MFLVVGWDEFSFFAPDLVLAALGATQVDLRTLEVSRARVPQAVVHTPISLRFFQVTGTIGRDRLNVDVGTPAVDLLYDLRGFHGSERDPAGRAFRWTGSRVTLSLPAGGAVTLVVGGGRPPGAPPAEIAVSVGERVLGRRAVGVTRQAIRLDLPETGAPGPIDLEIESTTFQPRAFGLSPDSRDLGVRLYGVLVHPPRAPAAP